MDFVGIMYVYVYGSYLRFFENVLSKGVYVVFMKGMGRYICWCDGGV